MKIYLDIRYNLKTDQFVFETNLKKERISEVISEFLRLQIGAGKDSSPVVEKTEYHIHLSLDLSDDSFYVTHDCGNLSLRDGLLLAACREARKVAQA